MPGTGGWATCPLCPSQAPTALLLGGFLEQLWDGPGLTPRRCCRQGACPGASAPHGFAEVLSRCVQVRIRPSNVSVTSPLTCTSGIGGPRCESSAPPADSGHAQRARPQRRCELCLRGGGGERGGPAAFWGVALPLAFRPGAPGSHPGARSVGRGCPGVGGHSLSPTHLWHPWATAGATRTVRLQLLSKETGVGFAGADLVFYNCSVLQS